MEIGDRVKYIGGDWKNDKFNKFAGCKGRIVKVTAYTDMAMDTVYHVELNQKSGEKETVEAESWYLEELPSEFEELHDSLTKKVEEIKSSRDFYASGVDKQIERVQIETLEAVLSCIENVLGI